MIQEDLMTTYYTYNEETKQLTPAKRVIVIDGKTMILGNPADFAKFLNAYPIEVDNPPTTDEYHHAVPDGYDLKDGKWVRKWRVEELPPPPPRTFSKLKVVRLLTEMGIWLKVRDYIVAKGLYDLFLAAQDFREDDPDFAEGKAALKTQLGWTDEKVEEILATCILEN